jgi:hypothetical protein
MTMKETLLEAMHVPSDSDTARWMSERGVAVTDVDTMSRAIHDVYCGITADHQHPNEKDHQQAQALIAALQKQATGNAQA